MTVEPPFLREVRIRNFKSISKCAVSFRPVTLLVGRNGSGKSNFLDALRFVTDGLQSSLDYAIRQRGGIDNVRRRSTGHPRNFAIEVVVSLPRQQVATYAFELVARSNGGFSVKRETLTVERAGGAPGAYFLREDARVVSASEKNVPPVLEDRLYLVNAAGLPEFRPVYDALLSVGFYNLNPETMKEPQSPTAGEPRRPLTESSSSCSSMPIRISRVSSRRSSSPRPFSIEATSTFRACCPFRSTSRGLWLVRTP